MIGGFDKVFEEPLSNLGNSLFQWNIRGPTGFHLMMVWSVFIRICATCKWQTELTFDTIRFHSNEFNLLPAWRSNSRPRNTDKLCLGGALLFSETPEKQSSPFSGRCKPSEANEGIWKPPLHLDPQCDRGGRECSCRPSAGTPTRPNMLWVSGRVVQLIHNWLEWRTRKCG